MKKITQVIHMMVLSNGLRVGVAFACFQSAVSRHGPLAQVCPSSKDGAGVYVTAKEIFRDRFFFFFFLMIITLADVTAGRHGAAKDRIPTGI